MGKPAVAAQLEAHIGQNENDRLVSVMFLQHDETKYCGNKVKSADQTHSQC